LNFEPPMTGVRRAFLAISAYLSELCGYY